jgi:hypothetical protein
MLRRELSSLVVVGLLFHFLVIAHAAEAESAPIGQPILVQGENL